MATFLSTFRVMTGATASEIPDTDAIEFLNAASVFATINVPPMLLSALITESADITDGNGYNLGRSSVVEVTRNGTSATAALASDYKYLYKTSSLKYAISQYPRYYIRDNYVYIAPDPTPTEVANVHTITPPTIDSSTDASTVDYVVISNIIKNYSAGLGLSAMAGYYIKEATSSVTSVAATDALQSAQDLIYSATGTFSSIDAESWITTEDAELAAVAIQAAAQEVNRANAGAGVINTLIQNAANAMQSAASYFSLATNEVSAMNGAVQQASEGA